MSIYKHYSIKTNAFLQNLKLRNGKRENIYYEITEKNLKNSYPSRHETGSFQCCRSYKPYEPKISMLANLCLFEIYL